MAIKKTNDEIYLLDAINSLWIDHFNNSIVIQENKKDFFARGAHQRTRDRLTLNFPSKN